MAPRSTSSTAPVLNESHAEYDHDTIGYGLLFILVGAFYGWFIWLDAVSVSPNWFMVTFGTLFVTALIGAGIWSIVSMPLRVYLYEDQMVIRRMLGSESIRWDEFVSAKATFFQYNGLPIFNLQLQTLGNRKVSFGASPKTPKLRRGTQIPLISIDQLIQVVLEMSAPARYNTIMARYNSGQRVDFKQFQLSREGVTADRETLIWPMVADIQIDSSHVLVKAISQERPWRTFPRTELLNTDILPEVVQYVRGTDFSAFQSVTVTPELQAAARTRLWRHRLFAWLLLPLFAISLSGGLSYGNYFFSAKANYDRGSAAAAQGDVATALKEFDQAVRKEPDQPFYYIERGLIHYKTNQFNAAASDFDAALMLNPNDPRTLGLKGMVLHQQGHFAEAIDMYNAALQVQPRYTFAYCQRGASYAMLGRREQAIEDIQRCRDSGVPAWQAEAESLLLQLGER